MKDLLMEWLDECLNQMKVAGDLPPTLLVKGPEDLGVVIMEGGAWGPTANDRYKTLYRLGATMGYGMEAEVIYLYNDAWMKSVDMPKGSTREDAEQEARKIKGSLRDEEGSYEVLLGCEYPREGKPRVVCVPYLRDATDGSITFDPPDEWPNEGKSEAHAYSFKGFWDGYNETGKKCAALLSVAPDVPGYTPEGLVSLEESLRRVCRMAGEQFMEEIKS